MNTGSPIADKYRTFLKLPNEKIRTFPMKMGTNKVKGNKILGAGVGSMVKNRLKNHISLH